MLKPKEDLIAVIEKCLIEMAVDIKKQNKVIGYCNKKYKVDTSVVSDYLRGQKELDGITPHLLFILTDGLDYVDHKNLIDLFYTPSEKALWEQEINNETKIDFPIRLKMLQISDDTWIGGTTVQQLNSWYKQQLINYNENTQRALKMSFVKGQETYRIFVNKRAVNEIRAAFHEGRFIPNTITLNLFENEDNEFYYNKETNEFVIVKMKMFDILDGYHRLLAMMQEIMSNSGFDYPMELRITAYSEEKARQFIYQEDQKTKMKKIDSDTYNVYSFENRVCNKINIDPRSDVQGMVGNNSEINQGWLTKMLTFFWFKGVPKENAKQMVFEVSDALIQVFNSLIGYEKTYAVRTYTYKELLAICYYASKVVDGTCVTGEQVYTLIKKIEDDNDIRMKEHKSLSRTLIHYLDRLVEG